MLTVDQEWLHYHDDKMIDFDAVCYSNGIWREPDILTKPEAKKPHQLYAPFRRVFIVPERAIIINASSKEPLNETKLLIYELMLKRDFSANMITVTAAKLWSGSPKKLPDRFKFLEKSIALSIRNLKALTELVDKKWLKKYKKSCEKQGK